MLSAPGTDLLPPADRRLFVEQFEKDLPFYQLFFLLMGRSCPIKNVDLVWVEHGPSAQVRSCPGMCGEALPQRRSHLFGSLDGEPHPVFCTTINGNGLHEAESCGISDQAAEARISRSGKAQVYRCNFGLTDIAVPVMVDGRHIATLFTGQVLREPPTAAGLVQIRKDTAHLTYVDVNQLEQAYWNVRVLPEEEIRNAIEILEAFAEFLGNSWLRLAESIRERRRRDRELQLSRKEFAHLVLEAGDALRVAPGAKEIRELMGRIGFTRPPNRVLLVRLEPSEQTREQALPFDLQFAAALQAIEEVSENLDNVATVHLRNTGICVFFHDPKSGSVPGGQLYSHRLTTRILQAVEDRCGLRARIGLGGVKEKWGDLAESHREAAAALAGSDATIAHYRKPKGSFTELGRNVEELCRLLEERRLKEAGAAAAALPALVSRRAGPKPDDLSGAGLFFCSAMEAMRTSARKLGCDAGTAAALCDAATEEVGRAGGVFEMHETWLRYAERILEEAQWLYSGKRKKLIARACRMIEHNLELGKHAEEVSITTIAAKLGVSAGHMSRTFRSEVGLNFGRYVMTKRVELAKRLLLDPLNNVSQVARRCGFSDPSYFARVFHKVAGCSPTSYCSNPSEEGLTRPSPAPLFRAG